MRSCPPSARPPPCPPRTLPRSPYALEIAAAVADGLLFDGPHVGRPRDIPRRSRHRRSQRRGGVPCGRPVGPSDCPRVVSGRSRSGASVLPGDVSSWGCGLALGRDGDKAFRGRLSGMRGTIPRAEKCHNHGPAPRAPHTSGSPRGTRRTDVRLSGERGTCQGLAAGSPSWPSSAARPWPPRDDLNPLSSYAL